jgi:hypothetical protein
MNKNVFSFYHESTTGLLQVRLAMRPLPRLHLMTPPAVVLGPTREAVVLLYTLENRAADPEALGPTQVAGRKGDARGDTSPHIMSSSAQARAQQVASHLSSVQGGLLKGEVRGGTSVTIVS